MIARALRKDPLVNQFRRILASSSRPSPRRLAGLCALALGFLAAPHGASAQGRLDARYEATLAGIPVGRGAWTIEISDDQFSAAASGGTSGLLKAFAGGSGTSASQGRIVNGALVPGLYRHHHDVEKVRDHAARRGQRQHQGIRDRAGAAGRSRPYPRDRRASPERASIR